MENQRVPHWVIDLGCHWGVHWGMRWVQHWAHCWDLSLVWSLDLHLGQYWELHLEPSLALNLD